MRVVLIAALLVAGCGGGGGGRAPAPTTATLTGRVIPNGSGLAAPARVTALLTAASAPATPECCTGEAVVWFADGVAPDDGVAAVNGALGTNLRVDGLLSPSGPACLVGGPNDVDGTVALVRNLLTLPQVAHAEVNAIRSAGQDAPVSLAPNDPVTALFSWSFSMVRTEAAWRHTRGDPGIVVAVIDSGVGLEGVPHPDLQGQLLPGFDFVDGDLDAADVAGGTFHGTHVAGTIGAIANNSLGVAGVSPGARLLPVRALNREGRGDAFAIAQAIRWSAGLDVPGFPLNPNPARVINMSLGSPASSQAEQEAIEAAAAQGVVLIAAAGNQNTAVGFPAGFADVIAVSAVGPSGNITIYSNFGPEIEVAAPGGDPFAPQDMVWSTKYDKATSRPEYAEGAGTSMACPHVAAVAALVLSANPALTPADVRSILQQTALDLGAPGRDNLYGFGLVDAKEAVERALELAGSPPAAQPAALAARTPFLRLTTSASAATLRLANLGDGTINVQSVSVFSLDGGTRTPNPPWLQAAIVQATITESEDGRVDVTADPALAGAGSQQALLEVVSDAGRITVPVLVVTESVPDLGTVTVMLTDADTGEVAATTTAAFANSYDFRFDDVPPGSYFLSALVDRDGDGSATRPDEWRGDFPSLDREALTLAAGETRSALTVPVQQQGESIRPGTGGGPITDALGVLVRNAETGLPLEGAQVILGDGVAQQVTDERGLAFFSGIAGPQTVTATASGFNATSFVGINATEIGIDLSPTRTGDEEETGVGVRIGNLAGGQTALVFVGFDLEGTVEGNDPSNPNAQTTVRVTGPAIVSVIVFDDASGDAVGIGYGLITEDDLAQDQALIVVNVFAFPAGNPLSVNVTSADAGLDGFLVLPVVIGENIEQMLHLGLAVDSATGTLQTPVAAITALLDFPASVLVFGINSANGGGSIRFHSQTVGGLVGASIDSALVAVPALTTPADSAAVGEGDSFTFSVPPGMTFGTLELSRPADGFEWTFYFGPGTTSVRIPTVGVLGSGAYEWQVLAARTPSVTFETLADLPSEIQESFAALEFFALSETRNATVP